MDRRSFLHLAALTGGTGALTGCRLPSGRPLDSQHHPVIGDQPKVSLAHLPTPLEELPRLTRRLGGPRLLVKRDDQTGLATGGNKARKLEYLIAAAQAAGADTVITSGGLQSNHCRQTAAAAARSGLHCVLLLRGQKPDGPPEGNLLLDSLLGAEVRIGDQTFEDAARSVEEAGRVPYVIPVGGSNAIGATAYVAAMEELVAQLNERQEKVDWIITATGSGGTQGGMAVGARALGFGGKILGIAVSAKSAMVRERLVRVANETAAHLKVEGSFRPEDFLVNSDYVGGGYGVMSDGERRAIKLMASTEGLLLDPVYTGRAFGGLLALIERGEFKKDETVLFWHTGGTPALFTAKYGNQLA